MDQRRTVPHGASRGFTLVELMVTIAIIAVLSSLALAGLAVARRRVQVDRTEMTIRKIHEVIMPHYENFLTRTFPDVLHTLPEQASLRNAANAAVSLVKKRRALVLEMPDGWADLLDTGTNPSTRPQPENDLRPSSPYTGIAARLNPMAKASYRSGQFSDAECLWITVMRGGFADPAIVGHFRDDEFGDKDGNGCREFIDAWGNPIRFLRWAPAFVSRYQPAAAATLSHDAFDPAARDPLAVKTLFPLIFSCGPDGEPAIACRNAEGPFSYATVAFDPYFATPSSNTPSRQPPSGPPNRHLMITNATGGIAFELGRYPASPHYTVPFGTPVNANVISDDVHNHAMSR